MGRIGDAVVLGLIQGVAEWLPVSSSGHLLFARSLFGFEGSHGLDVFLHFASLVVILAFFRRKIVRVASAFFLLRTRTEEFRLAVCILCATAVTGAAGLFLARRAAPLFEDARVLGFSFLLTSAFLFSSRRRGQKKVSVSSAFFVGIAQAVALLPGVSRSGATIGMAKLLGTRDEDAFSFSFLIAAPAMLGALVIERQEIASVAAGPLAAGFVTALAAGFFSLALLKKLVLHNRLHWFGWYTLGMGIFCLSVFR